MEKELCLRCGGRMETLGQEELQLGKYGFLLGSWSHLLSGALKVDICCCRGCKKLEFYAVDTPWDESEDRWWEKPFPAEDRENG